jgi:hypothetical protein
MARTKDAKNIETKKWCVVGVNENDDFVFEKKYCTMLDINEDLGIKLTYYSMKQIMRKDRLFLEVNLKDDVKTLFFHKINEKVERIQ